MFRYLCKRLNRPLLFVAFVGGMLAMGLPAAPVRSQAATFVDYAGGRYEQIEVILRADRAPAPGGIVSLALTATPLRDAPDLTLTWELADGGILLGGAASETLGAVAAGISAEQARQVQFASEGVYTVRVQATYHPNASTTLTAVAVLFFTVRAEGAFISDWDPRAPRYTPPHSRPTFDKSGAVVAADAWDVDAPQGCFYVTGFLTRGERQPAANPPRYVDQNGSAVPVHNILVEMREEDTFSDDSYGHTVTDANGKFEFRFCDDDGFLNDELELYTRVCAEVWEGPNKIVRIEHTSEQELYCFDSHIIDSEGGTVDFDLTAYDINSIEAAVFNIAHSVYWAWKYWNNNMGAGAPFFNRTATVYWERGRRATGSFYNDTRSVFVIADDASKTDEWDDSVIIHEWAHFADHQFSCNRNPGGAHTLPGLNTGMNGDKLSWGEGFADYYQSAVRTIMPGSGFTNFYIDVSGPTVDFETLPGTASALNEGAIAALLWDFIDANNDASDTVNHGHDRIQRVFADAAFQGNAQCNMQRFLKVWKDLGYPADAATAATVVQNVNVNLSSVLAAGAAEPLSAPANIAAVSAVSPLDYRWWDQVTMVVDNSASMAAASKMDAVKALIREQVNDLSANPRGTEFNLYTFDADTLLGPLVEGRFFAEQIDPVLNGLVADGADTGCYVDALSSLTQAAQDKYDGQAWVYTDGDAINSGRVESVRQQLNDRLLRGSVVLLGGCSALPTVQSSVSGAEKSYLGLAADGSQPGGIVPYLLTAIGTGGQFLFVPPDQLANAVDILRAQASHSAGAGRWSDYVSDLATYRWDRLEPAEFRWIDTSTAAGGADQGATSNGVRSFDLGVLTRASVYANGSIVYSFLTINGYEPYLYFNNLAGAHPWYWLRGPVEFRFWEECAGNCTYISTRQDGDWFAITSTGNGLPGSNPSTPGVPRTYQVLTNNATGEVRYQYLSLVAGDAGRSVIGIDNLSRAVVVSNQDLGGAVAGGGYKFLPAPPQPSKPYTVPVDSQIQSVGFLQTGYSGSFDPMIVQTPDGVAVDCADTANVLCLNLNGGLVQYVQVNVNGRTGVYSATVDAGPTGEGTFSFNALAASPIRPAGLSKHALALKEHRFQLDLGVRTDDGLLNGWLQTGSGALFGNPFVLYDDGAHEDEIAGDGIFGGDGFTPPGAGVAYLWVRGAVQDESITRSDPAPYNFQPLDVSPEWNDIQGFLGAPVVVSFLVTNQDAVGRCYHADVHTPEGWTATPIDDFCVAAGATNGPYTLVSHPLDDRPGGASGEIHATFTESTEGSIVGGDKAMVYLHRPLAGVQFDNRWGETYLRPNSTDTVSMTVNLLDDQGQTSGWSGALGYELTTTLGTASAPTARFENGRMPVVFTAGNQTGEALVTFELEGSAIASTTLQIREPSPAHLDLVATPADLRDGASASALVATLRDAWGDAVVGELVRLSVGDDDGSQGTINGGEVLTGTTDANGQVTAVFARGENAIGEVVIRAEALAETGSGLRVTHEDAEVILLSEPLQGVDNRVYLPVIQRSVQ